MSQLTPKEIEKIYIDCCDAELTALKPGNVHNYSAGHGMTAEDFRKAARLSAPYLVTPNIPVGKRIESAVSATMSQLKINVNLGIILLAAPLIAAREKMVLSNGISNFRHSLGDVLENLTIQDAVSAFRAIALANPADWGNQSVTMFMIPPMSPCLMR